MGWKKLFNCGAFYIIYVLPNVNKFMFLQDRQQDAKNPSFSGKNI